MLQIRVGQSESLAPRADMQEAGTQQSQTPSVYVLDSKHKQMLVCLLLASERNCLLFTVYGAVSIREKRGRKGNGGSVVKGFELVI